LGAKNFFNLKKLLGGNREKFWVKKICELQKFLGKKTFLELKKLLSKKLFGS